MAERCSTLLPAVSPSSSPGRASRSLSSVGPLVTDDPDERAGRQMHLQLAESDFDPLPFDSAAARAFGRIAADLRRAERKPVTRTYDALIAATAIITRLPLYTCNPGDFDGMSELDLRVVPHPDHAD